MMRFNLITRPEKINVVLIVSKIPDEFREQLLWFKNYREIQSFYLETLTFI